MPLLVGIDEAGYGPLLGPLIVGATIWQVPRGGESADLWQKLQSTVARGKQTRDDRLIVDDSKKVFSRKRGLASLERPILAFARAAGQRCDHLGAFLGDLTRASNSGRRETEPEAQSEPEAQAERAGASASRPSACASGSDGGPDDGSARGLSFLPEPWYRHLDRPLPVERGKSAYESIADKLSEAMRESGCVCRGLRARIISESAFNARVRSTRNKAAVIVENVLELMVRATRSTTEREIHFRVDRLGGRSDYRGMLQAAFADRELRILDMSDTCSLYRLTRGRETWTVEFRVGADAEYLTVALAGMLCKYVRELLMGAFNAYWQRLDPALQPTAGYYTDAKRFLANIAPLLPSTGLRMEQFVRER